MQDIGEVHWRSSISESTQVTEVSPGAFFLWSKRNPSYIYIIYNLDNIYIYIYIYPHTRVPSFPGPISVARVNE